MHRLNRKVLMILTGLSFVLFSGGMTRLHCETVATPSSSEASRLPVIIAHQGLAPSLERAPVAFDHDRHTTALKQVKIEDCALCHKVKDTDPRLANPEVKVFQFPKGSFDETDKTAIMYAYHNECVSCHRKMAGEGKKTGPDIGLCGKCHVRKPEVKPVAWAWSPIFNYLRHSKHLQAAEKFDPAEKLKVADKMEVLGEVTGKKCEVCHHTYDEVQKKLIYKKDSENSCRACHKAQDEKNARSMKKVAHSACVGCHMKLAEKVKKEATAQGRAELTEQEKKSFGPFECKGCHGEHKILKPDEIKEIPRLVRGQKDIIDISLFQDPNKDAKLVRMKLVPFNHKTHESTGQFCSSCHHHSLEKCSNCHTRTGDPKKGGGISFERAFHEVAAGQSCLGCHNVAKEDNKCAGCHQQRAVSLVSSQSSCTVCHRGPSEGKLLEVAPLPLEFDKEKVPEKALIKVLEKEFKPADMPHQKIIKKLTVISNESSLARVFHAAKDQALCYGCHHNSQVSATNKFPDCGACHTRPFEPRDPGKPGMMAAYHQQCMGCHKVMDQKPKALECDKCHPAKEATKTAEVKIPLRGIPE
jgi:hypothetical protein